MRKLILLLGLFFITVFSFSQDKNTNPVTLNSDPRYLNKIKGIGKTTDNRVIWKTSSGYNLDAYNGPQCNSVSTTYFSVFIDQEVKNLKDVNVTLSVWDVDESQGEVDVVSLNGQVIGTLHGANDSWSINNYTIDPSILVGGTPQKPGENRFEIYIDVNAGGWCVTVDWGAISALGSDFYVTDFTPGNGKLTDYKTPDLKLKFSDDVDMTTVSNTTIILKYLAVGGSYTTVNTVFGGVSGAKNLVTLTPSSQLYDGVKYVIEVVGGKDGVKSKTSGQMLTSQFFDFGTVPDLTIDKAKLTPIQVIRTTKQVRDKETVFRIYTAWDKKANVDPSGQFEKLPVQVRLRDESKNEFFSKQLDVERKDIREKPDRQKAGTNSLNAYTFYGVLTDGAHTIEAELEPANQVAATPIKFNETTPISIGAKSKILKVVYHFFLIEGWAAGVPQASKDRMTQLMADCKTFFRDNFPVSDVEFTAGADIDFAVPLGKYSWPKAAASGLTAAQIADISPFLDTVNNIVRNLEAWTGKGADVAFVGLIPQDFGTKSKNDGWTWDETDFTGVSCPFPDGTKIIHLRDVSATGGNGANASTVPHEFGHNYGISTKRFDGTAHTEAESPTEGFRVSEKKNKSSTEGNTDANSLKSLMSKYIQPVLQRWICDFDYPVLYDNIMAAALMKESVGSGPHLFISGGYDYKNTFYISPIWQSDYTTSNYPTQGDLTLLLLTSTGTQLSSYNFPSFSIRNLDGTSDTTHSFSIVVPVPTNLGMVRILKGSTVLKQIVKTANAPVVNITNPSSGAVWSGTGTQNISWAGTDADGDKLYYRVSYSNDNGNTFQSLAANLDNTSFSVPLSQLAPGTQCIMRVSATDGFNTTIKDVSFKISNSISVGLMTPANNSTNIPIALNIEGTFATKISTSRITSSTMTLKEYYSGTNVTGDVRYFAGSRTIRFSPSSNLKNNTKYTVTIKSGLVDTLGNSLSSDFNWYFTTIIDSSALNINSTTPYGSAVNVSTNSSVVVNFMNDVNSYTISSTTFKVINNQTQKQVTGKYSYDNATKAATFTPDSSYTALTSYKVILTTGIKTSINNSLPADYVFYFMTGTSLASGVKFTGNYTDAGQDDNSNGKFEWLVINAEVNLSKAGNYSVNGRLTDSKDKELCWGAAYSLYLPAGISKVQLKFDSKFINAYQANGPYKLSNIQIYNTSNTDLSDWVSAAYTTKAYNYTDFETSTIPVVTAFTPLDGAMNVPPNTKVTATFSRDMKSTSITKDYFYLKGRNNLSVQGTVSYDAATKTATLTPVSPLQIDSFYTAMITTSVRDTTGTSIIKQYNWSFNVGNSSTQTTQDAIGEILTYPNPFPHSSEWRGGMRFTYVLSAAGKVKIKVYNVAGELVKDIPEDLPPARSGYNEYYWDGKTNDNSLTASGTYLYIIYFTDSNGAESKKIGKFTVVR